VSARPDASAEHAARGDTSPDLAPEARVHLRGVAFVACGFDVAGGLEGQARGLAEAVARRGVPVTFLTTRPAGLRAPTREQRGLLEILRFPVLRPVDWRTTLDLFEVFALGALRPRLERLDLIYAVHHETGALASRIGEALGLPVVVKLACAGAFGDAQQALVHPERARIERGLRRATRVVAITEEIADEASGLLGLDPARIARLPNGVDRRRFRPAHSAREAPARILFVGRLSEQKRVDVLLDAFARLDTEAELVIVGEGPLREKLEAQARALGVSERTRFLGARDDVPVLLRDAWVFALPSAAEGASNALLEAMASGVPAVATELPGTSEVAGGAALLVPPGDSDALAEALERLLGDEDLRATLGAAGLERAAAFDLQQVAAEHVKLFTELAQGAAESSANREANTRFARTALDAGLRGLRGAARSAARVIADRLTGLNDQQG
jgi:phosphatidylinositol alpha-mannosyltransferase